MMATISNVRGGEEVESFRLQQAAAQKAAGVTVQDRAGRTIAIKRPGPVERMRLFKAIGGEASTNAAYVNMALLAITVVSIDGEVVARPTSVLQVEALVQRLGDDGLEAIITGIAEHFGRAAEVDQDAVKNS
jgi:hypothetical protein